MAFATRETAWLLKEALLKLSGWEFFTSYSQRVFSRSPQWRQTRNQNQVRQAFCPQIEKLFPQKSLAHPRTLEFCGAVA